MQAEAIIQQAHDRGIKDQDTIFALVRDGLRLTNEETLQALRSASFMHDGLLDPRKTTLSGGRCPHGFVRF